MDTWWWLALGAVVALSLVTALIDGGGRLARPLGGNRRRGVPLPDRGPRPGEIWWTRAPLLVLVLSVGLESARVVRVSTERVSGRRPQSASGTGTTPETRAAEGAEESRSAQLVLPPGTVADVPGRVSTLVAAPEAVTEVALTEFRRRAGEVGQETWTKVRHLSGDE